MKEEETKEVLEMMCSPIMEEWFWSNEMFTRFIYNFPDFIDLAHKVFRANYHMNYLGYNKKYYEQICKDARK